MKPVLQSRTKSPGNASSRRAWAVSVVTAGRPGRCARAAHPATAHAPVRASAKRSRPGSGLWTGAGQAEAGNRRRNFRLRVLGADPAAHAHPLARLEILVMLEEVGDLLRLDLRQ